MSLDGTLWTLNTYRNQEGSMTPALPNIPATLEFRSGRISGKAGCNTYFATYAQNDDKLNLSQAGSTMMACPPDIMAQEQAYLQALNTVASFESTGTQLTLKDASGKVVLVFDKDTPLSITGREWRATGINNGKQAVVSNPNTALVTATFGDDGNMSGSGGCNQYSAKYEIEGNTIKIGPAVSTLRACADEEVNQQEQAFFAALTNAATYRISGTKLELRAADNALQVVFVAE